MQEREIECNNRIFILKYQNILFNKIYANVINNAIKVLLLLSLLQVNL